MGNETSGPEPTGAQDGTGLSERRSFLESGAAFPGEPKPECIETHASLLFLTSDRAWKMKKPVRLHHIDLRELPAREGFCREELRLNRQLAGEEVYLGTTPLVRRGDGTLGLGGPGETVDWLIEMRRLPAAEMLDRRLVDGPPPDRREIGRVSDRMIRFYLGSRQPQGAGAVHLRRLRADARTNAGHLRAMWAKIGAVGGDDVLDTAADLLDRAAQELVRRGDRGLFVDGHGDLRPEHVCLVDPPVIFDRIEFDRAMRIVDPYEEFNALGLECALLGTGWIRGALLDNLARSGIPRPSRELLTAYGVQRCLTRARLAIDHLTDRDIRTPAKWSGMARSYLEAARVLAVSDGDLEGPPKNGRAR